MDSQKPRKIGVWVSSAEIQTSAVDTRTAVWVSTAEKLSKIVLRETGNFSRKFRGVSAPALYTGEIQKGTGERGRDRKCHKLSQIVVTFYDEFYDDL